MYMRTQLYKISVDGGTLVRPLFADFPEIEYTSYDPYKNSTVLYGDSMMVAFTLTSTLPEGA